MWHTLFGSQLRTNMTSGVLAAFIQTGAMAIGFPVCLSYLGAERYGVWLALATILQFAKLGDLGIGQAVVKLVAEDHGRKNVAGIRQCFTAAMTLLLLAGTCLVAALLVLSPRIVGIFRLSAVNAQVATWLLPYIALLSFYTVIVQGVVAVLSGLGRMDLANFVQAAGHLVGVLSASVLLVIGCGIESLLVGNAIAGLVTHMLAIVLIHHVFKARLFGRQSLGCRPHFARIIRFASGLVASSVLNMFLHPFNKLLLCRYVGPTALPIYQIAFQGALQIRSFAEIPLRAIMPEVSRVASSIPSAAGQRVQSIRRRAYRLLLAAGVPCYGMVMISLAPLLNAWLGPSDAAPLAPVLMIMLVGSFLSLMNVPAYYMLLGSGQVRSVTYATACKVFASVSVCLGTVWLTGRSSPAAVALAVTLGIGLETIVLMIQQQRTTATQPARQCPSGAVAWPVMASRQ